MSQNVKILAFACSLRKESYNKKLVKVAVPLLEKYGAEVTYVDLLDYQLPLFDEDFETEHGLPEKGRKLKDLFIGHDGFLISTPEYNGFFSGVFKNTIDWLSRPVEGFPPYECFEGKIAGLIAASPGSLGGVRALPHARQQLTNVRVHVIPEQFGLFSASKAFDEDNTLVDDKKQSSLESVCRKLVEFTKRIK